METRFLHREEVYKQTRIRLRAYTIALARDRRTSRNPLVTRYLAIVSR